LFEDDEGKADPKGGPYSTDTMAGEAPRVPRPLGAVQVERMKSGPNPKGGVATGVLAKTDIESAANRMGKLRLANEGAGKSDDDVIYLGKSRTNTRNCKRSLGDSLKDFDHKNRVGLRPDSEEKGKGLAEVVRNRYKERHTVPDLFGGTDVPIEVEGFESESDKRVELCCRSHSVLTNLNMSSSSFDPDIRLCVCCLVDHPITGGQRPRGPKGGYQEVNLCPI